MFCKNCGNKILEHDNFCSKCGYKVNENSTNLQAVDKNAQTNNQIVFVQKKPFNYSIAAFILSIAILPVSLIIRFGFAQTVVRYGWREYTSTILPDGIKAIGVIFILVLLILSIVFLKNSKKSNTKNKFKIPTIIIDILATALSFAFIFG